MNNTIPPYKSSNALTREQYALVRKVELATASNIADGYILAEVDVLRRRLQDVGLGLNSRTCMETLILLLYCASAISPGNVHSLDLSFAFAHAVNLAAAGRTTQERRTGYLFCNELLPRDHELQLMLVNTIRKDLDSDKIPNAVLALDVLIQSPSTDVIPAVQRRLYDMISHSSPLIRERALLAFRSLSTLDQDLLRSAEQRTLKRTDDPETAVVRAALKLGDVMAQRKVLDEERFQTILSQVLVSTWKTYITGQASAGDMISILSAITSHRAHLSGDGVRTIFEIIRFSSGRKHRSDALLLGAFRVLAAIPEADLPPTADLAGRRSPAHALRPLLASDAPNDHYLFLSCLSLLPPRLWSGIDPELPPVLDGSEVGRVMTFLDARDGLIRRKTLAVLHAVDPSIVNGYRSRLFQAKPVPSEGDQWNSYVERLLEVACAASVEDGAMYTDLVVETLDALDGMDAMHAPVQEQAVSMVLTHLRNGSPKFRTAAVQAIVKLSIAADPPPSPTFAVVFAAIICEHATTLSDSANDILHTISSRLGTFASPIQDASLLSMLRIAAEVDQVPDTVLTAVRTISTTSGRHIRRRCDQFLTYSRQISVLKRLVVGLASTELPEFLHALQAFEARSPRSGQASLPSSPHTGPSPLAPLSPRLQPSSPPSSKLRYEAYAAPIRPSQRLTRPASALSPASSDTPTSPRHDHRAAAQALDQTVTPGELALGGGELLELRTFADPSQKTPVSTPPVRTGTHRDDLITLDSPFLADPPTSIGAALFSTADDPADNWENPSPDFKTTWTSLASFTSRGWCDLTLDAAVRRLQSLRSKLVVIPGDQEPFPGSLKVIVTQSTGGESDADSINSTHINEGQESQETAALRLTDGEEDSCLWQMRCNGTRLAERIRVVLSAEG